jgi:hypothetical protein
MKNLEDLWAKHRATHAERVAASAKSPVEPMPLHQSVKDFLSVMKETAVRIYKRDPEQPAFTTEDDFKMRLDTCQSCEFGDSQTQKCGKCRCPWAKIATFAAKSCPAGKF